MDLSSLTNTSIFKGISTTLNSHSSTNVEINGVSVPTADSKVITDKLNPASLLNGNSKTVTNSDGTTKSIKVSDYYAPSKMVLDTYNQLGVDIDKSIKSAFLLQTFNIKGSEILCTMFCFLISLLPCEERNALAKALDDFNKGIQVTNSGAKAVNSMINTFSATGMALTSLSSNVTDMFNGKSTTASTVATNNTKLTTPESVSTLIAAPISVIQNAKVIINALKFGTNFKYAMPDCTGKGIWDLSQIVLSMMQGFVLQAADEAMKKVMNPVTKLLNNIWPAPCYGNMADQIRLKILQLIKTLKSRILKEIADMFTGNNDFNMKFRNNNKKLGWALELQALMDALSYISANFLSIAKACGISTCQPAVRADQFLSSDVTNLDTDSVNPFQFSTLSIPTSYTTSSTEKINSIDDISNKFKNFMNQDSVIVTPDTIKSTSNILQNAPTQIKSFIADGLLNSVLDNNYNIDPNTATVTYTYNKTCSEG